MLKIRWRTKTKLLIFIDFQCIFLSSQFWRTLIVPHETRVYLTVVIGWNWNELCRWSWFNTFFYRWNCWASSGCELKSFYFHSRNNCSNFDPGGLPKLSNAVPKIRPIITQDVGISINSGVCANSELKTNQKPTNHN